MHTLEEVRPGGRYLALERVQDPGNVGTLLRSAAAFGFDGVILSEGCASVYAPKTLRASMGAAVRLSLIHILDENQKPTADITINSVSIETYQG